MPADAPRRGALAPLALLLVVVFINIAGFSLILPLLPFYGRLFSASPLEVTLLFAAYSLGNIFGEIHWGRMSDKRGRRRVLAWTTACAALSYIAFAFAPGLLAALVIRVISGFFSGTLGVVQGYIADVSAPQDRARSIGYFGAAFNLGFVLGPALGGLLADPAQGLAGFRPPILTAAALAAGASLFATLVLKDARRPAGAMRPLPSYGAAFRFVGAQPILKRLFLLGFVTLSAFSSMEAVFGLWTAHTFGWHAREVGLTFIAVGAAGVLVQGFLIGPLVRRHGEARIIAAGLAVLILSMVLQPLARNPGAAVALMGLLMAGHSLAFPNIGALVSRSTPPESQGSVLGAQMATNSAARIAAPPFFGFLFASAGPDAPYYLCALLVLLALGVALQVVGLRDRQQAAAQGARA